jgi:putative ABC transport system ATP-binding protein
MALSYSLSNRHQDSIVQEQTLVELRQLDRHFQLGEQTVRALDRVDLRIAAGEYLSVMGPSGSGKSTLLNILGLLDRPSRGDYLLDGQLTTSMTEKQLAGCRQREIGFVFQSYHLIPRLSARANMELPLVLAGWPRSKRRERVEATLQQLGIADRADHLPRQLSGGQRQRVAIGRAMMLRPRLLLADEPTGNLDSRSGADVVGLLEQLNTEGVTLIVVTHDSDLGARARRRIRMVDGRIVADQTGKASADASV